jgi:hypothetical protein
MGETIERGRCRMFNSGQYGQYTGEITVAAMLSSAEDAFAVLPQDLEGVISICAEQTGKIQLPHSTLKQRRRLRLREDSRHSSERLRQLCHRAMRNANFPVLARKPTAFQPRWRLSANGGGNGARTKNGRSGTIAGAKESPPICGRAKSGRMPQARSFRDDAA